MRRGETKEFYFKVNGIVSHLDKVKITFRQDYLPLLEKTVRGEDNDIIRVSLDQEDTLLFQRGEAEVQLKICEFEGGNDTYVSNIMKLYIEDCLDTEVMTNEPE